MQTFWKVKRALTDTKGLRLVRKQKEMKHKPAEFKEEKIKMLEMKVEKHTESGWECSESYKDRAEKSE